MYTHEEYVYGWAFYLLGVLIIMVCGWILTAKIPWSVIRHLLRLCVGVVLLVPWYATAEADHLAPAWLIATFEGLFDSDATFMRAGAPMLAALAVALVFFAVVAITRFIRQRPTTK